MNINQNTFSFIEFIYYDSINSKQRMNNPIRVLCSAGEFGGVSKGGPDRKRFGNHYNRRSDDIFCKKLNFPFNAGHMLLLEQRHNVLRSHKQTQRGMSNILH